MIEKRGGGTWTFANGNVYIGNLIIIKNMVEIFIHEKMAMRIA